ncbi:site-specific DNA-methyltransferase [Agromyces seonyuensis]|uniref:Site-specific DNA-methyltransferase n=1 Tax=Agromyces seonyuensis TaxID=2662446 RepID=A0A6I4NUG9_9MICO|nr:site-specific DNA-methyltransferase [Agromyces seonyuensis]MWB98096.1 site-specific DNA-methyltransferase [Agromyces seonyuensis]
MPVEPESPHETARAVLAALPDSSTTLAVLRAPANPHRDRPRTDRSAPSTATAVTDVLGSGPAGVRAALARYDDRFEPYRAELEPVLDEAWRALAADGTLYLQLDSREAHYAKVLLDALVGRERFFNEIVWVRDFGAAADDGWVRRHDTILVYCRDPKRVFFDANAVDREPYMAPGLVTKEKAARGKLPTDVWWHTIVGAVDPADPERTPDTVLRRILQASSRPGDLVAAPYPASRSLGQVAEALGRRTALAPASEAEPAASAAAAASVVVV